MAKQRELVASQALEGIPHGFLSGIGHEGEPSGERIVAGGQLVALKQVHSPRAIVVDAPFELADRPQADALVTATPGLVLGIVTADCAPVLLADRSAGIVAAAHAGWRGAFDGVLEAVVDKMEELGAKSQRICAAIGPTIASASYEVDEAFCDRFIRADSGNSRFFSAGRPGHFQFDLEAYVAHRLQLRGVAKIDALGLDTYTDSARFHSYRRATHRGEPTYGRQFSLIALEA